MTGINETNNVKVKWYYIQKLLSLVKSFFCKKNLFCSKSIIARYLINQPCNDQYFERMLSLKTLFFFSSLSFDIRFASYMFYLQIFLEFSCDVVCCIGYLICRIYVWVEYMPHELWKSFFCGKQKMSLSCMTSSHRLKTWLVRTRTCHAKLICRIAK